MKTQSHITKTLLLAWPLVITQLGHILTGIVDNIFLGQLGSTEQAAGIFSNNLYTLILVFTIGVSYASTPLVTGAHVSNNNEQKAQIFKNSLFLNFGIALFSFGLLFFVSVFFKYMMQPEEVIVMATPFFNVLIFSMLPVSLFFTCKQYCEGLSNTKIALIISVAGNLLNIVLNYCLIYGKCNLPELGYMGSAWASFVARSFMGLSFLVFVFYSPLTREIKKYYAKVKINWRDLKHLARIGINAGLQFTFEVAAFAIAGLMAGSFGKEQLDAHGIALSLAAFTYMFGSGLSSAATIRIGEFSAMGNWKEIRLASIAVVKIVLVAMGVFGIVFLMFASALPKLFSNDVDIIRLAAPLLVIAAIFQLFDGLQVTMIGILRGLEDVKVPTYVTLVAYWVIALPLAYVLAYKLHMETIGIWVALLLALALVAVALTLRLNYLIRKNLGKLGVPS